MNRPSVCRRSLLICSVAALCLWLACSAGAATVSFSDTVPLAVTNWTSSVTIPLFNPALGTLNSVTFLLNGHVEGTVQFESRDAGPATVTSTLSAQVVLTRPDTSTIALTAPTFSTSDSVTAFDGVNDFGGTSGRTHTGLTADDSSTHVSPPPASDLALFTGIGSIVLPVSAMGVSGATGAGNLLVSISTSASAEVTVTYDYTPEDVSISIIKYVGTSASGPWNDANAPPGLGVTPGDDVFFQYVITNTGAVPLSGVTLTDNVYNAGSTPPFIPAPPIPNPLAPAATYTYVYGPVTALAGQHTNIATTTGTSPGGTVVTDTDPANYHANDVPDLLQAFPGNSGGRNIAFAGYASALDDLISSVPGIFVIVPQQPGDPAWANYIQAFQDQVDYTLKNVTLCKEHPDIIQCADVFPSGTICQQGTPNIRLRWPLMYEVPGTVWTLTIQYGTSVPYDDDGAGPNPLGYYHVQVWTWQVDATIASMKDLLELFHELPFGLDEVPLVSDEVLYPILQAKLDAIQAALDADPQDLLTASFILGDFEMEVQDACIGTSPARPRPTGPGTGIAETLENPACCKLMADAEYIGFQLGILQPTK